MSCLLLIGVVVLAGEVFSQPSSDSEPCQSLVNVVSANPQCFSLNNCTGLTCDLQGNSTLNGSRATFTVTKCVDPVTVDLSIPSAGLQRTLNQTDTIFFNPQGSAVSVVINRNATHLRFQATLMDGSVNSTAIPETIVPLNASSCMCDSLRELAAKSGHTTIEPECHTSEQCDSVICRLHVFRNDFFFENFILPCDYAVNVIIQDIQHQPTYAAIFNHTGSQPILVGFFPMTLYMEIMPHLYSMEISAIIDTMLFGNVTLLPRQTVVLDKTRCNSPNISIVAPTNAPSPPPALPSSAPEICQAFYRIILATRSEPFICEAMRDCKAGILCTLELLDSYYIISITVESEERAIIFSVSDSSQTSLGSAASMNATISLPMPEKSMLIFNQTVSAEKESIGFSLEIVLPKIGSDPPDLQTHSLINYTEIPVTSSQGNAQTRSTIIAVSVTVSIIVLTIIIIAVVLGICGCVAYVSRKNEKSSIQVQYKKGDDDIDVLVKPGRETTV